MEPETISRREKSKADKRERILRAAKELFSSQGFTATKTQDIADHADVATGTVFQYARSKTELLLMVMNQALADAFNQGRARAVECNDPYAAIESVIIPIVDMAEQAPELFTAFASEILFGTEGLYRGQAIELVEQIQSDIADILAANSPRRDCDVALAAHAIFGLVIIELNAVRMGRGSGSVKERIGSHIRLVLQGACSNYRPDGSCGVTK